MKKNENAKTQDMGSGSIPKLLAQLAIPAIVAQGRQSGAVRQLFL